MFGNAEEGDPPSEDRKGKKIMKDLVLAVDVAKRKSTYGLFRRGGEEGEITCLIKPFDVPHTEKGFAILKEKLSSYGEEGIDCFMESTGGLQDADASWLKSLGFGDPIVVNPAYVAKAGVPSLRKTKTDKADCLKIAQTYFMGAYQPPAEMDGPQKRSRRLSRLSESYKEAAAKAKTKLRESLWRTFPELEDIFGGCSLFSDACLGLISRFPTAGDAAKARPSSVVKAMYGPGSRTEKRLEFAKMIIAAAKASVAIAGPGSAEAREAVCSVNDILYFLSQAESVESDLAESVEGTLLYETVASFPGIGKATAAHIAAEIGNIDAYSSSPKKLVAAAGIEPRQNDSGETVGNYGRITKVGNRHLRKWLFIAVNAIVMHGRLGHAIDASIYGYYEKKRSDGSKHHYASLVACMNKLLRRIFYRYKEAKLTGIVSAR